MKKTRAILVMFLLAATACAGKPAVTTRPQNGDPQPVKTGPAYLGIVYTIVQRGVRVMDVMPESPAERAGILRGDVILKADGVRLTGTDSLRRQVLSRDPGTRIALLVLRGGRREFEVRPVLDVWDRRFPLEMQALP